MSAQAPGATAMHIENIHKTITGVTGILSANAQVRTMYGGTDGMHCIPVLHCVLDNIKGMSAKRVVLDLPCDTYDAANAKAKDLLKGRCIRFDAPLADACISFQSLKQFQIL